MASRLVAMRSSSSAMDESDSASFSGGLVGKLAPFCRTRLALQSRGPNCIFRAIFRAGGACPQPETHPIWGNNRRFDKPTSQLEKGAQMFVTPAFAQEAPPAGGGGLLGSGLLETLALPVMLILIFWLLIFRPQQKRMK